jgi:diaminopimelate epimerase
LLINDEFLCCERWVMRLNFVKMHGNGNDYLFFDCFNSALREPSRVAKILCKRRFSVGADGIVLILPSGVADVKMRIFNADGSEGETCGNALRCLGRLLYDWGYIRKSRMSIETNSGVRDVFLIIKNGVVSSLAVDMGFCEIGELFFMETCGEKLEMRGVDVGNKHRVTFVPDVDVLDLDKLGRACAKNSTLEGGVNTEFCEVVEKNLIKARVFERGSGETLACGSGACAIAAASVANGSSDAGNPVRILMRGGELLVKLDENMRAILIGGAQKCFEGTAELNI